MGKLEERSAVHTRVKIRKFVQSLTQKTPSVHKPDLGAIENLTRLV